MEKERIRLPFVSWFAYTMAIEFEAEKVKDQESFCILCLRRAQARCETLKIRYKIGSKKEETRTNLRRKIKNKIGEIWIECGQVQAYMVYYKQQKRRFAQGCHS